MAPKIRSAVSSLPLSPTLGANQRAAQKRAQGETVFHMGFGQSPFPVHGSLKQALADSAQANHYEHVAGTASLRERAGAYLTKHMGLNRDDYDVLIAPGSKLILFALQQALEGDILIPVPSWVSYAPQAELIGDSAIYFDAQLSDVGYEIDPNALTEAIVGARTRGLNPTKLILNSPNNPTGLEIPQASHEALAEVCREHDLFVISDEIYRQVSFSPPVPSFAASYRAQTAVTAGLSKHLSLGGWRVGVGLIPKRIPGLLQALEAIASETWSAVATPIQLAVVSAFTEDAELSRHIDRCTQIHGEVARQTADILRNTSVFCARPQGAFYLWPEFDDFRDRLAARGVLTSVDLADHLLEEYNVLTLAGAGFGAPADRLGLRLSVCDYDGSAALETANPNASNVEQYAPNVLAGARAIAAMVQSLR